MDLDRGGRVEVETRSDGTKALHVTDANHNTVQVNPTEHEANGIANLLTGTE